MADRKVTVAVDFVANTQGLQQALQASANTARGYAAANATAQRFGPSSYIGPLPVTTKSGMVNSGPMARFAVADPAAKMMADIMKRQAQSAAFDQAALVSRFGRFAPLANVANGLSHVQGMAGAIGLGGGVMGFGAASHASPMLGEHLQNSLRLVVGEAGQSLVGPLRDVAGIMQNVAHTIKVLPPALKDTTGRLAVIGAGVATGAATIGFGLKGILALREGLGTIFSGAVAPAVASNAMAAMTGRAVGTAGGTLAGQGLAGLLGASLASNPVGWAIGGAIVGAAGGSYGAHVAMEDARSGRQPSMGGRIGAAVALSMNPLSVLMPDSWKAKWLEYAAMPYEFLTGTGGPNSGGNPMLNRSGGFTSGEGFYQLLQSEVTGHDPTELREQQARGDAAFLGQNRSLDENTAALQGLTQALSTNMTNPYP